MHTTDNGPAIVPGEGQVPDRATRFYRAILIVLQLVMASELTLLLYDRQWQNAFLVVAIMALTLAPSVVGPRLQVNIPAEFQVLSVIFVFSAVFLGSFQDYYERFWWWDTMLHLSSGLLMGIFGFLLVYVLNASERVELVLRPNFVALFAFLFAVSIGTIWEIFEFLMDTAFDSTMQRRALTDPYGLNDTMGDLIIDTLSAFAISLFGWWYMKRGERSFIQEWIHKFIDRNPHMFRVRRRHRFRRLTSRLKRRTRPSE